jgi:serine/threonine-protein kinase TTK/MPS1
LGIGKPRAFSRSYHDAPEAQTPPQGGSGSAFSTRSSASSARVASLTDASTVSQSSMEPTPPSAYGHGHGYLARSSLSSNDSGGGSGSGGSGERPLRTYGGGSSSRTFQRHVSAPLGRHWPAREDKSRDTEEVSSCFCE